MSSNAIDLTREDIALKFEKAEQEWEEETRTEAVCYQRDDGSFVVRDDEGRLESYTAIDLEMVR